MPSQGVTTVFITLVLLLSLVLLYNYSQLAIDSSSNRKLAVHVHVQDEAEQFATTTTTVTTTARRSSTSRQTSSHVHVSTTWKPLYTKNNVLKQPAGDLETPYSTCNNTAPCVSFATPMFGSFYVFNAHIRAWMSGGMKTCGFPCQFVSDISQADALIFHGRDVTKSIFWKIHSNQTLIYMNSESPHATALGGYNVQDDVKYRFFFNLTATYKLSSDIYLPYGDVKKLSTSRSPSRHYNSTAKKNFAFIAMSNCNAFNGRSSKIKELQKYFPIDVFGSCSGKRLESFKKTSKTYRYYLSFENSFCNDYITEKFFYNGLDTEAIPVVFGGLSKKDYDDVAPPKSFIYALDFPTGRQLGEFLKALAANETEYGSYFAWRDSYVLRTYIAFPCRLCKKLYDLRQNRTVADLADYYDVNTECRPKTFKYLT